MEEQPIANINCNNDDSTIEVNKNRPRFKKRNEKRVKNIKEEEEKELHVLENSAEKKALLSLLSHSDSEENLLSSWSSLNRKVSVEKEAQQLDEPVQAQQIKEPDKVEVYNVEELNFKLENTEKLELHPIFKANLKTLLDIYKEVIADSVRRMKAMEADLSNITTKDTLLNSIDLLFNQDKGSIPFKHENIQVHGSNFLEDLNHRRNAEDFLYYIKEKQVIRDYSDSCNQTDPDLDFLIPSFQNSTLDKEKLLEYLRKENSELKKQYSSLFRFVIFKENESEEYNRFSKHIEYSKAVIKSETVGTQTESYSSNEHVLKELERAKENLRKETETNRKLIEELTELRRRVELLSSAYQMTLDRKGEYIEQLKHEYNKKEANMKTKIKELKYNHLIKFDNEIQPRRIDDRRVNHVVIDGMTINEEFKYENQLQKLTKVYNIWENNYTTLTTYIRRYKNELNENNFSEKQIQFVETIEKRLLDWEKEMNDIELKASISNSCQSRHQLPNSIKENENDVHLYSENKPENSSQHYGIIRRAVSAFPDHAPMKYSSTSNRSEGIANPNSGVRYTRSGVPLRAKSIPFVQSKKKREQKYELKAPPAVSLHFNAVTTQQATSK